MDWLENNRSQNRTLFDGEVILQKMKDGRIQFKFRKNSYHKIISNEEYLILAKDNDKIYFKESDAQRGFHLLDWGINTKYFQLKPEKLPLVTDNFGEYNLEFDTKLGLHYISLNRKLEKTLSWEGR